MNRTLEIINDVIINFHTDKSQSKRFRRGFRPPLISTPLRHPTACRVSFGRKRTNPVGTVVVVVVAAGAVGAAWRRDGSWTAAAAPTVGPVADCAIGCRCCRRVDNRRDCDGGVVRGGGDADGGADSPTRRTTWW